jgi:pimeloyl-ACP methyl ester carboxylesterase
MKKLIRRITIGAAALMGVLVLAVAYAALRPASTAIIEGPNSIAAIEKISLGGIEQTLLLRGHDRTNPVLLFVHGGPGLAHMPVAPVYSNDLEKHFVVAHLDQRGSGSSCAGVEHSDLTIDRLVDDTIEVSELLAARFGGNGRIFLLGHSWGTVLGTLAAQRRPELFHAYIGVSQVVHGAKGEKLSYEFVEREAKRRNDQVALEELAGRHPPYTELNNLSIQRKWLLSFGGSIHNSEAAKKALGPFLFGPEWTLGDRLDFYRCFVDSANQLWPVVMDTIDFPSSVPRLEMPVYFFAGRHDWQTPQSLVEQWAKTLEAPKVELIWFQDAGHVVPVESPEAFQQQLIERVRPGAET